MKDNKGNGGVKEGGRGRRREEGGRRKESRSVKCGLGSGKREGMGTRATGIAGDGRSRVLSQRQVGGTPRGGGVGVGRAMHAMEITQKGTKCEKGAQNVRNSLRDSTPRDWVDSELRGQLGSSQSERAAGSSLNSKPLATELFLRPSAPNGID